MSVTRIDQFDSQGRLRHSDVWFIYNAFAMLPPGEVLIKVGISMKPVERMVSIHCCSPFPIDLACFVPVGSKKRALSIERKILSRYASYSTRGEWLRVPDEADARSDFAKEMRTIVSSHTGRPVEWKRINGDQIRAAMSQQLKKIPA